MTGLSLAHPSLVSFQFQNSHHRGEILVSLCYQPATNKVTAVVLKAKNLPKFDITGLAGETVVGSQILFFVYGIL